MAILPCLVAMHTEQDKRRKPHKQDDRESFYPKIGSGPGLAEKVETRLVDK